MFSYKIKLSMIENWLAAFQLEAQFKIEFKYAKNV